MKIKLIALDLDGTLLDSQKHLSPGNRKALETCCKKGIQIVPTTGRTVDGIPDMIKEIPGIRYAITTNGAVIEDMKDQKRLEERLLTWELALELIETASQYDTMYDLYIERRGVTEPRFYDHLSDYGIPPQLESLIRATRDVYPSIKEYVKTSRKPVEKMNLFFSDLEERERVRAVLEKRGDILITSSMAFNLELNALGATKGGGILRLADHLGISREQTMAIGDGENDFSMIEEAGIGVAMKNGLVELQNIADYITETNDEDGVALAIAHFIDGDDSCVVCG